VPVINNVSFFKTFFRADIMEDADIIAFATILDKTIEDTVVATYYEKPV
jgi:hypothetical protein